MAKLIFFIVKPYKDLAYLTYEEKQAIDKLKELKVELCEKFGGLTESATEHGFWLEGKKLIEDDLTEWTIYSATVITPRFVIEFAERIKTVCKQKVQLVVINEYPYFI